MTYEQASATMGSATGLSLEEVDPVAAGAALPTTPVNFDAMETGKKIAKETVVLELHVRAPGFTRSLSAKNFLKQLGIENLSALTEEQVAALSPQELQIINQFLAQKKAQEDGSGSKVDPDFLHISQDLIDYREINSISKLDYRFNDWVVSRSVPSPMLARGLYLMPLSLVEEVDKAIAQFVKERNLLIDNFEEKYTALKADAETKRGPFFDAGDYPPFKAIRAKYRVEARYLSFNVPAALEQINRELYAREQAKVSLQWAEAAQEVRDALRVSFKGLVDHFADRLGTDDASGKPRVFRNSAVTKLTDFLGMFENRDLTDDAELATLVAQAKQLVMGVDPVDLRKNEGLRSALESGFKEIAAQSDLLITTRERKFALDEYEEEEVASEAPAP